MYNFLPLVRDWLNAQRPEWPRVGQTLRTLRQRYDAACAAALATPDGVRDDKLHLGAPFWSEGFRDIAGFYAGQVEHLAEHGDDVRRAVRASREGQARRTTVSHRRDDAPELSEGQGGI